MDNTEIIEEIGRELEYLRDIADSCSYVAGGMLLTRLDRIADLLDELDAE